MRETSELPTTSLPHPPRHSRTLPRHSREGGNLFPSASHLTKQNSRTTLDLWTLHETVAQGDILNPQSAISNPPNSPSTESDRMQHNPTRYYRVLRKLVPARDARTRARRPLPSFRTHPRHSREGGNPPRRLQNPTESNTMLQGATKTRARARGIPSRHSRTHPHHSHTHPRHSREGGNPSPAPSVPPASIGFDLSPGVAVS